MTAPIRDEESLDGAALRNVFAAAARLLKDSAPDIDAINVYPVPDGDTGSNMSATFREAVDRALALNEQATAGQVLSEIARGALYGARGNSGVILSQALRGFASGVGECEVLSGAALADGLEQAATQAYRAVSQPQEGTMLTVLRAAGEVARERAATLGDEAGRGSCFRVLSAAVTAAEAAEAATIDQLPSLKEAGVTDAGGEGICVILRGLLAAISGRVPEVKPHPAIKPLQTAEGHGEDPFGYCTEFLLEPRQRPLDVATIRSLVESRGSRSVVVVGDEELVRVHAHSLEPEPLIEAARELGHVSRVKVEDMSAQNVRFREGGSGAGAKVAMLAMSRGAGFDEIFESLGAAVSDLGVVEKPPAGQIASAADALRTPDVIVLANHRNVVLAAQQAKELTDCTLHVIPTTSLPQGIAAAIAFDAGESPAANLSGMVAAATATKTVEVTIAGADRTSDGIAVKQGQPIVLIEGKLVGTADSPGDALIEGLRLAGVEPGQLVTIYAGQGVSESDLSVLAEKAGTLAKELEVEGVMGGQALYPFIASIE
ncbi:MAG: DAK2 domain-containing protein [Dehalococcoidia bacterium]